MNTIPIINTLSRGTNGDSPFPTTKQEDAKIAYITVATTAERLAIPEWKRYAKMTVYDAQLNTEYTLGTNITIAGQVWTEKDYGIPSDILVHDDVLDIDGFIKPQLIRNIFLNSKYVVDSEVAMLALNTLIGNFVIRTDENKVYVKLNDTNPASLSDFTEMDASMGVISVNGQTGVVTISIANLLTNPTNLTDFRNAVTNSPSVLGNTSAIISLQGDVTTINAILDLKADLVGGKVPLDQLPDLGDPGSPHVIIDKDGNSLPQRDRLKFTGANVTVTDSSGTDETIVNIITSAGNPFADNIALIKNNADNTKLAIISAVNISTATTRTYTLPDFNGDILVTGGTNILSGTTIIDKNGSSFTINGTGTLSLTTGSNTYSVSAFGHFFNTKQLSLGGDLFTSGTSAITFTSTGTTGVTLPTTGTLATTTQLATKQDILTNGNGTTISGTQVNLGGTMMGTTTFLGGGSANIDYGSFGNYFGTIRIFTANSFRVESTLGSQVLDFSGSTTTFNAGANLALIIAGSLGTSGYVLTSNGSTASWAPSAGGSYPGPASGTTGDMLRWDVTGLALENFTPTSDPTTTDGDLIQRSGGVLTRLAAVATGNALISGGVGTISSWGKISLTTHVSGDLPFANLTQGSALSVLGVTGNAIADHASIAAGTDGNVLRRSGTSLTFGSLDLTLAGTVGSSILGIANGGTGSATQNWVGTTGNQTGLAGNKTWTGTHTWQNASVADQTVVLGSTISSNIDSNNSSYVQAVFSATAGHRAVFGGARGRGTNALKAAAASGDVIFDLLATTYTGTATVESTGRLSAIIDGAVSAGNAPLRWSIFTSATNEAAVAERVRVTSGGRLQAANTLVVGNISAITAGSVLVDFISTTLGVLMPRVTNIASVTTPVAGMIAYDAATNKFNFRENAAWVLLGGITNTAAANELMMSNGTNAVASGIFSNGSSTLTIGSSSVAGGRILQVGSSDTDAPLGIQAKGDTTIGLTTTGTTQSTVNLAQAASSYFGFSFVTNVSSNTLTAGNPNDGNTPFIIKGRQGVSSGVYGATLQLLGGDGSTTGNTNGGHVYINTGAKNGTGVVGNLGIFTTSGSFGTGEKVMFIGNATTVPSTNPTGGDILYADSGILKYRDTAGNIITI